MEHSEQIDKLSLALAKAQGSLVTAKKNAKNPFLKNDYADLTAVWDAARNVLSANGLAVMQPAEIIGGDVIVTTVLAHESGQWMSSSLSMTPEAEKGKSTAQVIGSIISYLRRYGLMSIVGVTAEDDDDDGNAGNGQAGRTRSGRTQPGCNAPAPRPEPEPEQSEPERPLSPDVLKEMIAKLKNGKNAQQQSQPTRDQLGGLRASLKMATGGDSAEAVDQGRHLLLDYLLGHNSSTEITAQEYYALNRWLKPTKQDDGEWTIDEMSSKEAKAAVVQAAKDQGQGELL